MAQQLAALFLTVCIAIPAAIGKPNILFILADDLGVMDVGFMGDQRYDTPNLDRLATEGIVFTEAYAPASNCAPSRAAILSGKAAPRTGVYTVNSSERGKTKDRKLIPTPNTLYLSDDIVTIADVLKAEGYTTGHIGKWHVSEDPKQQGIGVNIAGTTLGYSKSYFSPYKNPALKDGPTGEYLTDRLTDEAISFIDLRKSAPFFLYLPYYTVHTPLQAREDLLVRYEGREDLNPTYAAMVAALDKNVGRLLRYLEQSGLSENTLVVFSSDNGGVTKFSSQDPYRSGKGSYYEGGIRVPLTIRWPGTIDPGSQSSIPVTGLDLYPTFIEATGGPALLHRSTDNATDGVSLMPLITGSGDIPERALFWHFPIYLDSKGTADARDPLFRTRPGSVMRLGDWKLHEFFEDGGLELFNLNDDVGERHNLVDKHPDKLTELHDMLIAWRKEVGAPVPAKLNPEYRAP